MKTGLSIQQLAAEIARRAEAKQDFIAPAAKLRMDPQGIATPILNSDPVALRIEGQRAFGLNKVAHNQLAEYAGIPAQYYKRMLAEKPGLLASNVNTWLGDLAAANEHRMIRTLDGTVRAVLSRGYRTLENEDLAEAILPTLLDMDLHIASADITDTRLYIKAIDKRILVDVPTGRKLGDGSHTFFDTVSPAIVISNSEVGHGALSIETSIYTKACTNLAMFGPSLRKSHIGTRASLSDEVYTLLTDDSKRLNDAALWSSVRDVVRASFDEAKFKALTEKLGEAAQQPIDGDVVQAIKRVAKKFAFTEGEQKGVLASLIEGGDLTRYGLHSAVTHFSAKIDDYDRATELERHGGGIIELPRTEWQALLRAA